jgi:hypothetical protein
MGGFSEWLPAAPFAQWLNQRVAYWENHPYRKAANETTNTGDTSPTGQVCYEIGWLDDATSQRRLYRMRHQLSESSTGRRRGETPGIRKTTQTERFNRRVVEEALHHAGVLLSELYPYEALIDEFVAEYLVPRDLAQRLADEWIEATWQAVWNRVGLFVTEEDRPRCYCRSCKKTTRLFMGTCGECGAVHAASVVAAITVTAVKPSAAPITDEILAQASWLRQQYQLPYQSIAAVMAVYHGVPRSTETWRKTLRRDGAEPKLHGTPFKGVGS